MKIPFLGRLGSHAATPQHSYFALLAMVETSATPPMAGAQSSNPLYGLYVV